MILDLLSNGIYRGVFSDSGVAGYSDPIENRDEIWAISCFFCHTRNGLFVASRLTKHDPWNQWMNPDPTGSTGGSQNISGPVNPLWAKMTWGLQQHRPGKHTWLVPSGETVETVAVAAAIDRCDEVRKSGDVFLEIRYFK